MARVKITKIPKALSGLEVKMSAGLYGKPTNGNRQFTLPNQIMSQKFAQEPTTVRNTLQPVAREGANLEAEKGETAVVNVDGLPAHFKIGGKRHSQGGTPLNLPDNSFIFSDTAKMKIKDPIIIAQFGMVPKKAGYTPAEIAKKFDINKFRQILADPNSEDLQRKTAEAMISNYNLKLAKLALIQESMKGFPQGIPAIAMPYIIENDIDPSSYLPTQSQEEEPDADTGEARYGGNMISQFDTKQKGGAKKINLSQKQLEDQERILLGQIKKLRENDLEIPSNLADTYNVVKLQLDNIRTNSNLKQSLDSSNLEWVNPEGLRVGDPTQGAKGYWDRVSQNLSSNYDIGNLDPRSLEYAASNITPKGYKVPTLAAQQAKETLAKIVHPSQAEGVLDYLGNLLTVPGKGTSGLLTGNIETAGQTYLRSKPENVGTAMLIDFASDPTTYLGAAPYKGMYLGTKAAVNKLPKAYAWAAYLIPEYYTLGKEFAKKHGTRALEAVQNLIKDPTVREIATNVGLSALTRAGSASAYDKPNKDATEYVKEKTVAKSDNTNVNKPKIQPKKLKEITPKEQPVVKDVEVKKKPAAKAVTKAKEENWDNVDWSKYKE